MKNIILLAIASLFALTTYSMIKDIPTRKIIIITGNMGIINNVNVSINNNTLITTFDKDMDNVSIIVRKRSGEIVSEENLNAREFDQVRVNIQNYKEGEYNVEISTPEGTGEGNF